MARSLVLNATYEPLCVVPIRRAVVLLLAEKAVLVEEGLGSLHSERMDLPVPSVLRLARYVKVPHRREISLTRHAVLERDRHRCVYCQAKADTIDHVRPRSRGGQHVWTNVVAACHACNRKKGSLSLEESGMVLLRPPRRPTWRDLIDDLNRGGDRADWLPFLAETG